MATSCLGESASGVSLRRFSRMGCFGVFWGAPGDRSAVTDGFGDGFKASVDFVMAWPPRAVDWGRAAYAPPGTEPTRAPRSRREERVVRAGHGMSSRGAGAGVGDAGAFRSVGPRPF